VRRAADRSRKKRTASTVCRGTASTYGREYSAPRSLSSCVVCFRLDPEARRCRRSRTDRERRSSHRAVTHGGRPRTQAHNTQSRRHNGEALECGETSASPVAVTAWPQKNLLPSPAGGLPIAKKLLLSALVCSRPCSTPTQADWSKKQIKRCCT
jgi:hypothetical protein